MLLLNSICSEYQNLKLKYWLAKHGHKKLIHIWRNNSADHGKAEVIFEIQRLKLGAAMQSQVDIINFFF